MYMRKGMGDVGPHTDASYGSLPSVTGVVRDYDVALSDAPVNNAPVAQTAGGFQLPATIAGIPTKTVLVGALVLALVYMMTKNRR